MLRLDGASARRHEPVRALTHARARHWTPAAAKCIIGAVQGLRRAGRVLARPGAAPLRRLRRHLPLQGRLYGQLPLKKAPLQGELDAPQGAARGGHCRLAAEISCKAWQNPAPLKLAAAQTLRADASIGSYAGAACRPPSTARVPRIVGRAFTPAGEVCGGWNISVLHRRCPAKPCDAANPKRRAKSPALQSPRKWAVAHKRQPTARPAGGPEGYLQGPALHPSADCGGTSPYRGGFTRDCRLKRLPCKGSWLRHKAQPEGGIAALRRRYSCKARQNPALCFAGDDLRAKSRHFVPAALRNAACGRQCLHRPAEPCGGLPSPFHRPCALHCRAGVHARRGTFRPPAARKAPLAGELAAPQGAA